MKPPSLLREVEVVNLCFQFRMPYYATKSLSPARGFDRTRLQKSDSVNSLHVLSPELELMKLSRLSDREQESVAQMNSALPQLCPTREITLTPIRIVVDTIGQTRQLLHCMVMQIRLLDRRRSGYYYCWGCHCFSPSSDNCSPGNHHPQNALHSRELIKSSSLSLPTCVPNSITNSPNTRTLELAQEKASQPLCVLTATIPTPTSNVLLRPDDTALGCHWTTTWPTPGRNERTPRNFQAPNNFRPKQKHTNTSEKLSLAFTHTNTLHPTLESFARPRNWGSERARRRRPRCARDEDTRKRKTAALQLVDHSEHRSAQNPMSTKQINGSSSERREALLDDG